MVSKRERNGIRDRQRRSISKPSGREPSERTLGDR
jgi:hypothetical protein